MKTINEMSLEELAEYVVTLDGWIDGIPGLKLFSEGGFFRITDHGAICHHQSRTHIDGSKYLRTRLVMCAIEERTYPDLNDPATLGCLLAMVRKRLGAIHVWVSCGVDGYYAVQRKTITHGPYAGGENSLPICWDDSSTPSKFRSETHALVAALAKEVNQ